ncbi:MAG TPA: hypothetical protein VMD30_04650 [Tepidisphaeraceae bacterium]|nr:hypothetical protein [Tepidisphaeraceae bacterium]
MKKTFRCKFAVAARPGWLVIWILALAALGGCASADGDKNDLFETNGPSEVGATNFAITSVTRWSDVEDALQPNFSITEEQALQEVMPVAMYATQADTEQSRLALNFGQQGLQLGQQAPQQPVGPREPLVPIRRASGAGYGYGPGYGPYGGGGYPPQYGPYQGGVGYGGGYPGIEGYGQNGAGVDRSGAVAGGSIYPQGETGLDGAGAGGVAIAQESGKAVGIEPQLRYSLATSLLQYVRLTNRFVRDLVDAESADVYVVRVQVTLMPLSREAQYDTYTDIAFIGEDGAGDAQPVQIVPLLSTDSLEGLMQSQSASNSRDLALSLQALIAGGAGAGIDAEKLSQTLKAVSGEDVNSLLTMGRVTDNTVRVRLGAFAQPSGDFVMVPRSVAIPVVMLVPRGTGPNTQVVKIHAISKTVFVNAVTGKLLRGRTHWQSLIEYPSIRDSYHILKEPYRDSLAELYGEAAQGDMVAFSKTVRAANGQADFSEIGELWLEAQSLRATDAIQSMTFLLPKPQEARMPPADQTAVMQDDGAATTVALRGGASLSRLTLQGVLEVEASGQHGESTKMRLYASQEPVVSANGEDVLFTFPSLLAAGMNEPLGRIDPESVTLCVSMGTGPAARYGLIRVAPVEQATTMPSAPAQSREMAPVAGAAPIDVVDPEIAADQTGEGSAVVRIETVAGSAGPYRLWVDGAEIAEVTSQDPPGILVENGPNWEIRNKGTVELGLRQCDPNKPVEFELRDSANKTLYEVTRRVRAMGGAPGRGGRRNGG